MKGKSSEIIRFIPHMEKPEMVNEAIWQWLEEKIQS